jgi:hypothetical protein
MKAANTLAYFDMVKIAATKSFLVQDIEATVESVN